MRVILLICYVIFSTSFTLNMNFNNEIKILNSKISSHKINSNKEVSKFSNGKMNELEVRKFTNKCLFLNKEYSLIKFYKFLENNEEGKKIILKNFNDLNLNNRLGFNELEILRKNGFVLVYSKRGEVLGGLLSIKLGSGEVIIGYLHNNENSLTFKSNSEEVSGKNYYFSNLLIKRISKMKEKDYYLNCYIIEKYLKNKFEKSLRSGISRYDLDNKEFTDFFNNLKECDYSYSLNKLEDLYNDELCAKKIDINILNDLDIYLNK